MSSFRLRSAVLFSLYHFFICLLAVSLSYYLAMKSFDQGLPSGLVSNILSVIALILMSPLLWVLELSQTKVLSGAGEWLIFAINSLLWGISLELFIARRQTRKQRRYFY